MRDLFAENWSLFYSTEDASYYAPVNVANLYLTILVVEEYGYSYTHEIDDAFDFLGAVEERMDACIEHYKLGEDVDHYEIKNKIIEYAIRNNAVGDSDNEPLEGLEVTPENARIMSWAMETGWACWGGPMVELGKSIRGDVAAGKVEWSEYKDVFTEDEKKELFSEGVINYEELGELLG